MPVYVDELNNWGWRLGPSCHLIADTNEELHAFAAKIGLKRRWFQKSSSAPHYDLTAGRRAQAVAAGAVEITRREMVEKCRKWRQEALARMNAAASEEERAAIRDELYR
jgi:hypothetical protein